MKDRSEEDLDGESKEKLDRYSTYPDMVERIIIGNKEFVKFDFNGSDEMKKAKVCDIALSVVDGMGDECSNVEFDMNDNYEAAIDKATGKACKIDNNLIKDVKIIKGIALIELRLKSNYNKALKFVYYVEV